MTILDAFSTFKSEELLANNRSQSYIDGFWWMIRSLTDMVGNIDTQDITLDVYNEWRLYMNSKHRISTVHTNVSRFRIFAQWLVEENLCTLRMSKVKAPRRKKPNPVYWTTEDVTKMIAAAQTVRDKAIIDVLFSCGLRNTECRELRRTDLVDNLLHVQHGVKGDDNRWVRLSDQAKLHLDIYLASRVDKSAYMFVTRNGKKIANSTFRYVIAKIGERAGIDPVKRHPHAARHGCATYLMEGGMHMREIQDYLGHAFITTTQIYTHPERNKINAKHAEIFDGKLEDDSKVLQRQIMSLEHKLKKYMRGNAHDAVANAGDIEKMKLELGTALLQL